MDRRKTTNVNYIMEKYSDSNPLPAEKQEKKASFEIISHVFAYAESLSEDEIRAVVATANYMFLTPVDRQQFIETLATSYRVKKSEILAWEKAISTSMEEPLLSSKQLPFDESEVLTYTRLAMVSYETKIATEIQALLQNFFATFPNTFKRNINYRSIVGAAEYAIIVNKYVELKNFDQQTLADKYDVSRTSIAVWYRNIKKYCAWEAWH
ncbi:hypothetical protein [Listeria rocourtiae]|uniref:hypothetical protein n=1 Tax=Listeria rocourtiae TaxID=647910 RepID=UPI003D2F83DC